MAGEIPKSGLWAEEERRSEPRFCPDPLVPVFFGPPATETPTAGLIADVSNGGARIVAPPTARPGLHWPDPVMIQVTWSDSARSAGIEGIRLHGRVVRIAMDATGYTLHLRFERGSGEWPRLEAWIGTLGR